MLNCSSLCSQFFTEVWIAGYSVSFDYNLMGGRAPTPAVIMLLECSVRCLLPSQIVGLCWCSPDLRGPSLTAAACNPSSWRWSAYCSQFSFWKALDKNLQLLDGQDGNCWGDCLVQSSCSKQDQLGGLSAEYLQAWSLLNLSRQPLLVFSHLLCRSFI